MKKIEVDPYLSQLVEEFSQCPEVDAIALGGSHTVSMNDCHSDFDVYIYLNTPLPTERRKLITDKYCQSMDLNLQFWEPEDDGVLKSGVEVELIYRSIEQMTDTLHSLVHQHRVSLGYSTCFWANLLNCEILYEENLQLSQLKQEFALPYPHALAHAIIDLNLPLLCDAFPNYPKQIKKALMRNDQFSVLHRTNEYLASYFDVLFAINRIPHPGEKRLLEFASDQCPLLPTDFRETIDAILQSIHLRDQDASTGLLINAIERATENLVALVESMGR